MFKEARENAMFTWDFIGDVKTGRPNLGEYMPVDVYRLMQFTLRDTMIQTIGVEATNDIFFKAGKAAGIELYRNLLTSRAPFGYFINEIQEVMKSLKIGILRVEEADIEAMHFILTVAEDLDCSGLPMINEQICTYDEGFIAGLLSEQTGHEFSVQEIDCWCSGDRVCRFEVKLMG